MDLARLVARDSVATLRGSGPVTLNWLYLVEWIAIAILVIFYFFYLNRFVGIVVSLVLRALYWRKSNAYFDIGGISFSLLGGEIIFSDVRYISRNQSFRVVKGSLVWRYWLRRTRSRDDKPTASDLPCRLSINLWGAEWFLYNRTPSYDAILEQLGVLNPDITAQAPPWSSTSKDDLLPSDSSRTAASSPGKDHVENEQEKNAPHGSTSQSSINWYREALPIEIKCTKGSITMGNPSTPSIIIAGFEDVVGTHNTVKARSEFDDYKEIYHLVFSMPKIVFRTNPDYAGPLVQHGDDVSQHFANQLPDFRFPSLFSQPRTFLSLDTYRELVRKLFRLNKQNQNFKKEENEKHDWTGLPRYQSVSDDQTPTHRVEYAKVTTLLSSPQLEMTYYCDNAGKVPAAPKVVTGFAGLETNDIGNGDLSPEWGVDMIIRGGSLTYGPWADRQRTHIQQVFTPTTFYDQKPMTKLRPGDQRVHTALKIFVEFSEGTTFRIPTRESSKDWRYDTKDSALAEPTIRPYGWLDISMGPNSTLSYVLPMVNSDFGYETLVEVHLDAVTISSSVNYATFLHAETCRIHCSLPSPLAWNELRTWSISTALGKPDILLLRDHITLFTDVAKDWTSGPPGEFEHFVPFHYAIDVKVTDYALRLYVNDHNIINNPAMIQDNSFVILKGPALAANVGIPSHKYRMDVSDIQFRVAMEAVAISMSLPDWNTHSAFLTERSATFATAPELSIDGTYRFYAAAHPDNVERLALKVDCHDVVFKAVGWMVRHMFNLRDNYFGTFTHFVTLEEYRHRHARNLQGDPLELKHRPGQTDVFEVAVSLDLRDGVLLLPQELYDCQSAAAFLIPQLQVDLRNHDYFMEMSLNVDPFRIIEMPDCDAMLSEGFHALLDYADCIRVQGLEITANRLFGPQPRTATYMAGNSIGSNFVDSDNCLPPDFSIALDPDATFLSVDLHSIDLSVRGQGTAAQLDISEGVTIRFDDLEQAGFLKHVAVEVPCFTIRALAPLFGRAAPWMEVASIDADFSLVIGLSGTEWEKIAKTQLEFIASQDAITRRCPFLYNEEEAISGSQGGLYLQALGTPLFSSDIGHSQRRNSRSGSSNEPEDDVDDASMEGDDVDDASSSSSDDAHVLYQQLPGRRRGGDRFSAYGTVLRLCERSPESAFLDRPTFRRLPVSQHVSDDLPSVEPPRQLPSLVARLEAFGSRVYTKPVSRTAVDLTSRQSLRIVLTPVSTQVAADILSGIDLDTNYEHTLDDLLDNYAGSSGAVAKVRYNDLEVRATLPGLRVESIQDVLRPEDAISIKPQKLDDKGSGQASTVLCTVRLSIENIAFTCRQKEDAFGGYLEPPAPLPILLLERYFSGTAGQTRLEVFHPPPTTIPARQSHTLPSTSTRKRNRPTALDLVIGPCEAHVDITPQRALVKLVGSDSQLDFVDEAAELIIGTVWSWRVVHDVAEPMRQRAADRKSLERRLVWSIATVSERAGVTSFPTFLNRASYLVSRTNLRSDDGWKTLHHLRHCMRVTSQQVVDQMLASDAKVSSKAMLADLANVMSRWETWAIDAEDLVHTRFLTSLFDSQATTPDPLSSEVPSATLHFDLPWSFEWRTGRFTAALSDDRRSDNRLVQSPLEAYLSSTGRPSKGDSISIRGRFTLSGLEAAVDRDLIVLIRHIIRVRHTFERKLQLFSDSLAKNQRGTEDDSLRSSRIEDGPSFLNMAPDITLDLSFGIRSIAVSAIADTLEAKARIQDISLSSSLILDSFYTRGGRRRHRQFQVINSAVVGHLTVSASDTSSEIDHVLLATELEQTTALLQAGGSTTVSSVPAAASPPSLHIVLGVKSAQTRVPRDAVRVYEFVETWRASALPEYDTLLTELRHGLGTSDPEIFDLRQSKSVKTSSSPSFGQRFLAKAQLTAQLAIPLISVEVQAIPALKVGYVVRDISAHAASVKPARGRDILGPITGGLLVGAQAVRFIHLTEAGKSAPALPAETAFDLPVVRLKLNLDTLPCRCVQALTIIDSVSIRLTASIIDNILTVQEHFGKDVDELLQLIRSKRTTSEEAKADVSKQTLSPGKQPQLFDSEMIWDVRVALRGFKVAIEGPQAIQWIEAELLEARARSSSAASSLSLHWEAAVSNLALSLALRESGGSPTLASDRRYRLAFFRLDLSASNAVIHLSELPPASIYGDENTPHLHLRLPRINAVLQPTAIEALGDLIDFFQQEIEDRRKAREAAMVALQERVVQTIDEIGSDEERSASSWFASCVLSLEISTLGVAIPLNDDEVQELLPRLRRAKSAQSRPAFLMTIPTMTFAAQRGSAAYARVSQFALQFVPDFDQGRKEDFEGTTYQSLNRVALPEMKTTMRSPTHGPTLIHSQVSGLEVDLEPSVVAYAFSLIDVYRLSHERFSKFAPSTTVQPDAVETAPAGKIKSDQCVRATFSFESGTIRLHSSKSVTSTSKRSSKPRRPQAHHRGQSLNDFTRFLGLGKTVEPEISPDVVRLPSMSLWAEFHEYAAAVSPRLHLDINIHASNNTLYPTLLPFISAVAGQLKSRALRMPSEPIRPLPSMANTSTSMTPIPASSPLGGLQIAVSLKVDQSRLEISCLPAAEVTARLTWESGGFVFSFSPDTKAVDLAISIDGVSAGLRHSFSPEDCLSAGAKGLAASIAFLAPQDDSKDSLGLVSAVINVPDVSAEMNFRHLQDWLCLKAVWLDRMDLGSMGTAKQEQPCATSSPSDSPSSAALATIIQIQISHFRFLCDLGQSIGRETFVADSIACRIRWVPRESRCLAVSVNRLRLDAQGRLAGDIDVDGFMFSTLLRDDEQRAARGPQDLLGIQIGLGKVVGAFGYEFYRILVINSDPIAVSVSDDWTNAKDAVSAELLLAFHVRTGSFNIIATTATVPMLATVNKRIAALIDEKSAQADATISAAGLPPRPSTQRKGENVVAQVASALGTGSSDSNCCSIRVINRLHIELERIRIAVFPEHFNDGEVFRLDAGSGIRARLVRGVDSQNVINRDLHLFLGFFSIRKVTHRKLSPSQEAEWAAPEWFELFRTSSERNIFKIGTTEVSMESFQAVGSRRLRHKFSMLFGGQVDIALNYALLRNLGNLASAYQRQMDEVNFADKATSPYTSKAVTPLQEPSGTSYDSFLPPKGMSEVDVARMTITGDQLPKAATAVVSMKPTPLLQAATGDTRELEFEAIEMNVHQPKLNLLGDATPPLEWIGLQRDRFPAWIHTGVASPLEELLIALSSTYQTQLARQKLGPGPQAAATASQTANSAAAPPPVAE